MTDYKDTLNLPQTTFPMRANLAQREPQMLADWQARDLYGQIRRAAAGRKRFVLLDGPPYANGKIHLGHAVNGELFDLGELAGTPPGGDDDDGTEAAGDATSRDDTLTDDTLADEAPGTDDAAVDTEPEEDRDPRDGRSG